MTCREKLTIEHPDLVGEQIIGGCWACPNLYGYMPKPAYCMNGSDTDMCTQCWDREIPGTESLIYEHSTEPIGKVIDIIEDESGVTAKIETANSYNVQNEKEKNMATKKTKADLEKELEAVKEYKEELEKELKNLEKYKQYEDVAGEIHALYMSFVTAGFSEEQAYDLLKTMILNASNINFTVNDTSSYRSYRSYKR